MRAVLPQIHDEIEAIFATKTLDEWTELSAAAELTFAPVATLPEYIASEQAQAAGAVAELEHPMFPDGLKLPNTVRAPTRPRHCRIECWLLAGSAEPLLERRSILPCLSSWHLSLS